MTKYILVPLDKISLYNLNMGKMEIAKYDRLDVSEKQFTKIYNSKLFDLVNASDRYFLDEFEDALIDDKSLLLILSKYLDQNVNCLDFFLRKVKNMIDLSIRLKTGVYFSF